jgi:hypothetical protein
MDVEKTKHFYIAWKGVIGTKFLKKCLAVYGL